MANLSLVSVIIPTFNYGHFIGATLESLLAQTYRNWECIIIDDGSSDNTHDVVETFCSRDTRFKYIYQENKGMSAARNIGIKEAAGSYIQFLDADDLLEKRKFESQVKFLVENPDIDMVYCDARYFPSEEPDKQYAGIDGSVKSKIKKISGGSEELLRCLLVDNIIVISCPLLRKSLVESFGFFDEKLRTLEDWDYWLRCINHPVKVHFTEHDEGRALIRYHSNSASRSRIKMLETNIAIRRRLVLSLQDNSLLQLNRVGLANATIALITEMCRSGRFFDAIVLLLINSPIRILRGLLGNITKRAKLKCIK